MSQGFLILLCVYAVVAKNIPHHMAHMFPSLLTCFLASWRSCSRELLVSALRMLVAVLLTEGIPGGTRRKFGPLSNHLEPSIKRPLVE